MKPFALPHVLREELVDFAVLRKPDHALFAAAARELLSIYLAVTVCEYM